MDRIMNGSLQNTATMSNIPPFSLYFTLVQEGKGGELTHDETTIISGALDLTEKVLLPSKGQGIVVSSLISCLLHVLLV